MLLLSLWGCKGDVFQDNVEGVQHVVDLQMYISFPMLSTSARTLLPRLKFCGMLLGHWVGPK